MEITKDVLVSLGFKERDKIFNLKLQDFDFFISYDETFQKWTFWINDGLVQHSILHVEDMMAFATGDGYDKGYLDCKKDFRKFIGI